MTATDENGIVHQLSTATLCGRDAASWSREVTALQQAGLVIECPVCMVAKIEQSRARRESQEDMVGSQPMKQGELGRYVCVAQGGCLHSPHITIRSDGVWVRSKDPHPMNPGGYLYSAHRDCYENWRWLDQDGDPVSQADRDRLMPQACNRCGGEVPADGQPPGHLDDCPDKDQGQENTKEGRA